MTGQWLSQTRRLNRHYQSGGLDVPDLMPEWNWSYVYGTESSYQVTVQSLGLGEIADVPKRAFKKFCEGTIVPVVTLTHRNPDTIRAVCTYIVLSARIYHWYELNPYVYVANYTWNNQNLHTTDGYFNVEYVPPEALVNKTVQMNEQVLIRSPGLFVTASNYGRELSLNSDVEVLPGIEVEPFNPGDYERADRLFLYCSMCVCIDRRVLVTGPAVSGKIRFEKR